MNSILKLRMMIFWFIPHENWHHGIVGIVSSKITEKYYKPSICLRLMEIQQRAAAEVLRDLICLALWKTAAVFLEKFGGHELAAGLTIKAENIEAFRKKINEYAKGRIEDMTLVPTISLDAQIKVPYITIDTVHDINKLQPFGVNNPTPSFSVRNIKIHRISVMSEGKHLRMTLYKDGKYLDTVGFGMGDYYSMFREGDYIDVAFALDINDYKGFQNVQLILKDMRKTEFKDAR